MERVPPVPPKGLPEDGEPKKPTGKITKGAPSEAQDVSVRMEETFQAPNLKRKREGYADVIKNHKAKKFRAARGDPKDAINEKMKKASGKYI